MGPTVDGGYDLRGRFAQGCTRLVVVPLVSLNNRVGRYLGDTELSAVFGMQAVRDAVCAHGG